MVDIEIIRKSILQEIESANNKAKAEYEKRKQEIDAKSQQAREEFSEQTSSITEEDYVYIDEILEDESVEEIDELVAEILEEGYDEDYYDYDYDEMDDRYAGEFKSYETDIYTRFYNNNVEKLKSKIDANNLHISDKNLETIIKWRYAIITRRAQVKFDAKKYAQRQAYARHEEEAKYYGISKNRAWEKIYERYYFMYLEENKVNDQIILKEVLQAEMGIDTQAIKTDISEQYNSSEAVKKGIEAEITQGQEDKNSDLVIDTQEIETIQGRYQQDLSIEPNVDILSAKIAVQCINPEEVSKEFLGQIKQLTNSKKDVSEELVQGCLEKYAKSIDINELEDSHMQFLYENNYNGDFQSKAAKRLYDSYCREQAQKAKIQEQEEALSQKDAQIEQLNATVTDKNARITSLQESNQSLVAEGEQKSGQIDKLQKSNKGKDAKIEDEKERYNQLENENTELRKSNLSLINRITSFREENGKLLQQNQQLVTQNNNLQRENTKQLIIINAYKRRMNQLEAFIEKQKNAINEIIKYVGWIKSDIVAIKENLEPKNLLQRIASRFMGKNKKIIDSRSENINYYAENAGNLLDKSVNSSVQSIEECIAVEKEHYRNNARESSIDNRDENRYQGGQRNIQSAEEQNTGRDPSFPQRLNLGRRKPRNTPNHGHKGSTLEFYFEENPSYELDDNGNLIGNSHEGQGGSSEDDPRWG